LGRNPRDRVRKHARTTAQRGARSLSCVWPSGSCTGQVGALVQNQLAKIGVAVTIQSVPGADFYNKYVPVQAIAYANQASAS
jgi:hypothetical protein